MITIQDFIKMLSNEQGIIKMQTDGLTQEDSLLQPQPSGNCMNWVLGHTLENQVTVLKLLGGESPISETELEIYKRESEPIKGEKPGVLLLERLLEGHRLVNEKLVACLQGVKDEDFEKEITWNNRTYTLGWRIFFLHFHYTYHIGQLELLRQLAGKTDKVI